MPELPEVETTVRGVRPFLTGKQIEWVRVNQPSLRWMMPPDFADRLVGDKCVSISRRAKYIQIQNEHSEILAHLGMSGSFRLVDPSTPLKTHDHVQIRVKDLELRYHDPRRFGCLLWAESDRAKALLQTLGPEPLSDMFDGRWMYAQSRHRSMAIKTFIMSNQIVVGVGNIYASESLFMSGISPLRAVNRISKVRYELLADNIKSVLAQAIESGGTTLRDFVNGQGEPGYFQQALAVYGRDGQSCFQCGGFVVSQRISGRNSYFCKACQR